MKARSLRRDSGLTMIEVVVASVILTVIVGMASYLVWNSSRTVASSEVTLQMENVSREFFSNITKELHQSKMAMVRAVPWNNAMTINASTPGVFTVGGVNPLPGSGNAYTLSTTAPGTDGIIPAGATTFSIIRFKLPGVSMDITKSNANFNANPEAFNLAKYKALGGNNDQDYTIEIQYWWEIDNSNFKNEGVAGDGPGGFVPDGVDNNLNGVTDEGVIKKVESRYNIAGNLVERHVSTVLRNVPYIFDPLFPTDYTKGRPGLVFCIPNTDGGGTAYVNGGTEKRIYINLTMEAADPREPKNKKRNFFRTFTTYVDVRNLN